MSGNLSGVQIGKYYIDYKQVVGKGNSGNVYKGFNTQTNEQLAIKVINMNTISGEVPHYLLEAEKKALTTIKNQYVISAKQIFQHQDNCYIIMQYCEKGSLKDYISTNGKLDHKTALQLFRKIVTGYIAISEAVFIHRDLKSANILLRANGEPVIIDFGYCQMIMNPKKPGVHYNVGTPSYMAPEVYVKTRYSQKADVWSLGIIFYQMITGKTLDQGIPTYTYFVNLQNQGKPRISLQGMNPVCREFLEAALQVYPQKRASSHKLKYFIDKALIPQAQTIGKGYAYTPTNIKFGQNTTNTTNMTNKTDMTNIGHITNLNNNTNNTNTNNTNNTNNGFINFNGNTNSYNNAKNNQQFQFVKPQSCTNISWQESNNNNNNNNNTNNKNNNNNNHNFNYFPLQKPVTPIYQRNFAQQYHMVNPESSRQFQKPRQLFVNNQQRIGYYLPQNNQGNFIHIKINPNGF